ncbi:MAG: hypothetical protein V1870_02010 [Candidatus Aenigmatarchaeota archaeon]
MIYVNNSSMKYRIGAGLIGVTMIFCPWIIDRPICNSSCAVKNHSGYISQTGDPQRAREKEFIDAFSKYDISDIKYLGTDKLSCIGDDGKEFYERRDVFSVNFGDHELTIFQRDFADKLVNSSDFPIYTLLYCRKMTESLCFVDNSLKRNHIGSEDDVRVVSIKSVLEKMGCGCVHPKNTTFYASLNNLYASLNSVRNNNSGKIPTRSKEQNDLEERLLAIICYEMYMEDNPENR